MLMTITNQIVLAMPSDGLGGVAAGVTHAASVMTYTATTAVSATVDFQAGGAVVGGVFVTADGFWGIITAVATVTVTVDHWRSTKWGTLYAQRGIPANGNSVTHSYAATNIVNQPRCYLTQIDIKAPAGGGTPSVEIVDILGTTIYSFPLTATSAPIIIPFANEARPQGEPIRGPLRARFTSNSGNATIHYEPGS